MSERSERAIYPLQDQEELEIGRLERQHEVWAAERDLLLAAAGFTAGDRIADLGCGPGDLTLDLAAHVGPRGEVLGVDRSERFLAHLEGRARERGLAQVKTLKTDLRELDLPAGSFDGIVARWSLMFVPEAEDLLVRAGFALRRGGTLVVMEYAALRGIRLWPDGQRFRSIYLAVHELITAAGGDPDIGGRMPSLVRRAGLEVRSVIPIWRVGGPGSPLWNWLEGTHPNLPGLVERGLITAEELEAYLEEWREHSSDEGALLGAPPMLITVASKP